MLTIAEALQRHGLPEEQIKFELFASRQPGRAKKRVVSQQAGGARQHCEASRSRSTARRGRFRHAQGRHGLLDAAIANDARRALSCKAGVCSTCRAKVLEGEVEM